MEYNRKTMKTKILTKVQVYILNYSHFTDISSICHLCSVLTVKSTFCVNHPSKIGQSFKIWNNTAMKFDQNAFKYINMKSKKNMSPKEFDSGSYWQSPIRGGTLCLPQYQVELKTRYNFALYMHTLKLIFMIFYVNIPLAQRKSLKYL